MMRLRPGLSLSSSAAVAPPVYATIDSASLQFQAYNRMTGGPGISYLKQTTTNMPGFFVSSGTTVGDGCLIVRQRTPWARHAGFYNSGLLGSGTVARCQLQYYGPRHATAANRGRYVFDFGPNGTGISAGLTASQIKSAVAPRDCRAGLLLAMRRTSNTLDFPMVRLDDLTLIADDAPVTSSTAALNAHQSAVYVGANATADPATTLAPTTATHSFDGEIAEIIYINGTVSDADLIAIAGGAPVETVFTPSTIKWHRRLTGTDATSLAPVAGTGDTTSSMTASGTFLNGTNIGRQASASYLTMTAFPLSGSVWPIMPGSSTAQVSLSGKAAGVTTVQARAIAVDDGEVVTNWADVGTVSAGAWSGTLSVPASAGEIVIDVRDKDNTSLVFRDRTRQAIGVKVLVLGQSPDQIMFDSNVMATTFAGSGYASVSRFENKSVDNQYETHFLNGIGRSDGIQAAAYEFQRRYSNMPIEFVCGAVTGTLNLALMYDADTTRKWSDLVRMLDHTGYRYSVVVHRWGNSDFTQGAKYGEAILDPIINGTQPDLAANYVLDGVTYGAGDPPPVPDHYLRDGTLQGSFAMVVGPVTRATGSTNLNYENVRIKTLEWIAANGDIVKGANKDLMTVGGIGGTGAASPHPAETVAMGNQYQGAYLAEDVLRGMSASGLTDPTIASVAFTDGVKNVIRVTVTLPSGGSLKTYKDATWAAAVQGFEVSNDGGSTWSSVGFTAAIATATTVTLTKASGSWTGGGSTKVRYLYGAPVDSATLATDQGTTAAAVEATRPTEGCLFASEPQVWRDSTGGDLGLSVQRMEAAIVA